MIGPELIVRFLCAFLSGALLSQAGSLIQVMTRNNLASPSTLGLDGVVVFLCLIAHFLSRLNGVTFGSEALSLLLNYSALGGVFLLLYMKLKHFKPNRILNRPANYITPFILIGLCLNLFVGSIFSTLQFYSITLNYSFPDNLWFGSFRFAPFIALVSTGLVYAIGQILLIPLAKRFHAMSFGTQTAINLGIRPGPLLLMTFFICYLYNSVVISFFGVFAFLSLIFPHLLRLLPVFRFSFGRELIIGPWASGCFLMVLDMFVAYFPFYGSEIPVGIVSALFGTLFLIVLMLKKIRLIH